MSELKAKRLSVVIAVVATACSGLSSPPTTTPSVAPTTATSTTMPTTSTSVASTTTTLDQVAVGRFLQDEADDLSEGLGGVVIVWFEGGEVAFGSSGADPSGAVLTPSTPVLVASITKMFTAVAVLALVEDGAIDLDASASTYLTRIDVDGAVTVRDLLQHRSGIPSVTDVDGYFDRIYADPSKEWTPEEVLAVLPSGLEFTPGSEYRYSNTNYLILGVLVEEVTGKSAGDVLEERVFDPADMRDSHLATGAEPLIGSYSAAALVETDYTSELTSAWTAGGAISTGTDLNAFFTALFSGDLLSESTVDEMTDASDGYGLGILRSRYARATMYGHGGGITGFVTLALHDPDRNTTLFMASDNDAVDFRAASANVVNRLAGG